ncbi:MAG: glycosyltransferase family 9 protein [Candidatus Zixiibacteriota bacterium]
MITKTLEQGVKRLGLRLLSVAAPKARPRPTPSDLEHVARILVVKPDERIGNAVLVTPLLVALKGKFSRARLVLLMGRRFWDLHEHLPSADEFIPFEKARLARNPLGFLALVRRLRSRRFDLVFDAAGDHEVSFTHLALTALSGAKFRVGHDRGDAGLFYEVPVAIPVGPRHAAEMHLDLLRAVTPIRSHPRPLLRPRPDTGFAARFIAEHGWDPALPFIVIHPGARGRKQWPPAQFVRVIELLKSRLDANLALVWGPADTGAAIAIRDQTDIAAAGVLPLADFLSLVRRSTVFVSGDCGPMHLAAAAGARVVAIFLASDPEKYRPLGLEDITLDGRATPPDPGTVADAVITIASSSRRLRQGELPLAGAGTAT